MDAASHAQERRKIYAEIPRRYNGVVHMLLLHAMACSVIGVCAWRLDAPRWWELALIPSFFVFANFFEYFIHKGPLHHRTRGLDLLFERHTLTHHAYFHYDDMKVRELREFRLVLFPAIFLPMLVIATAPIPLALYFIAPNLAYLFEISAIGYYLVYEWFHTYHHLFPESGVARLHRVHHDPAVMTRANFNVSFPLADWLLRTRRY